MSANPTTPVLNNPRIINGWAFFDWANSAYALVISTAIFPGYFESVTDKMITIGGHSFQNTTLYAWAVSLAYLLIALASPTLSGIADYGGMKKYFLKWTTTVGAISCMCLFFFEGMPSFWLGITCFIVSFIGFAGGLVFYNSYLPEIATENKYDSVSARGFAFGYMGSVILLVFNLIMIQKPEWFGIPSSGFAARLAFVSVGLWWLGFAQIPLRVLPDDPTDRPKVDLINKGFEELKKVWAQIKVNPRIKGFLAAFFFYNAGVNTVIYLASLFATKELKFETSELIVLILILQIVAIVGAYLSSKLSEIKGNKFSLLVMIAVWIVICLLGYLVQGKQAFYLIGGGVGMVMGGIQSLSRSTYSKLLPKDSTDTASFFSFMDVTDKLSVVFGTFAFGFVELVTGSIRNSLLILGLFFVVGFVILWVTKLKIDENIG
jgi:MFS transporter, UMF1 family